MKRLTLEEIGKLAGVSRATVSRVVNQHPNISEEVRERVEAIIKETGYQPNLAARSLASNHSNILGLVIPSVIQEVFSDPYYPSITQGITQACNENGYTLSLFLFHSREEEKHTIRRLIGSGMVDGLIITADNLVDPFAPLLHNNNLPFVQVGRPLEGYHETSYVDVDNVQGAYLAIQHLINIGRKRIATVATAHNTAGIDRHTGYVKAIEEWRGRVDHSLVIEGDFTEKSGYRVMKTLLNEQPDAVFVHSDLMALGVIRAIREAGLRIPDDIAVVGFDDLPPALLADPPLTTIRQPTRWTGKTAVEMLLDKLRGDTAPRHVILPVELVVRESTVKPQK